MTNRTDRIPPQDIEAEVCVLASMVIDPGAATLCAGLLRPTDFYRPAHEDLFSAMLAMQAAREPVDLVTLKAYLAKHDLLKRVGGIEYIAELVNGLPNAANAGHYAATMLDASLKRELITLGNQMATDGYDSQETAATLAAQYSTRLHDIHRIAGPRRGVESTLGDAARNVMADLEDRYRNGQRTAKAWQTGFPEIDEAIHGLRAGHLVTLAAATGAGKTTLAINIATNVAEQGGGVLYVSAEMLPVEIAQRALQAHSGVSGNLIHSAQLRPQDWEQLSETEIHLRHLPVWIIGKALDVGAIAMRAQRAATQWDVPLGLIVVDYLQIMRLPPARELRERISTMTASLKQLAMDLQCPILMLSQFNREESKSGKPPGLHGMKESGSIENDSNAVILLHRPLPVQTTYDAEQQPWIEVWCQIAKCRDGKTTRWPEGPADAGGIRLRWQPNRTRFAHANPTPTPARQPC